MAASDRCRAGASRSPPPAARTGHPSRSSSCATPSASTRAAASSIASGIPSSRATSRATVGVVSPVQREPRVRAGGPGQRTAPPPRPRPRQPGHPDRAGPAAPAGTGPPRPPAAAPGWSPAPAHHHRRPAARRTAPRPRRSRARSYPAPAAAAGGPAPAPAPRPPAPPAAPAPPAPPPPPPAPAPDPAPAPAPPARPRPRTGPPPAGPPRPASRVLPAPPGPVTVTSRLRSSRAATSRTGPARPTKLVSAGTKPCMPPAEAGDITRRLPSPGRQHLRGLDAPQGRRDEQRPGRLGQAQRAGQPHRGVLAGRAVDAPLQVTDRPRAHPGRLGQLLLRQPGPGPQLPQQPGQSRGGLLRHDRGIPSPRPQPRPRQQAPRGQGPCPRLSRPGARATSPGTGQPAPRARSGRPDRSPGPARRYRPPARSCRPAPCTPPAAAPSCGSPVRRTGADHTGPRPHQDQRQPGRAGRPAPPGAEPVIRPLPPRIPGRRSSYGGPESPQEQGAMAESAAARSSAPAGVPDPASRPGKQA